MKVKQTANIERIGVSSVQLAFEKMGYIFREQAVSDYGIDAHIEIVKNNKATGQLIAAQIKSGSSWFKEKNETGIIFRSDNDHLQYWLNHSLPVIVVLYDPEQESAFWQIVDNDTVEITGKGWKLEIPFPQQINTASKEIFERLVGNSISPIGNYTILSLRDVSHGNAKRYTANILVPESFRNSDILKTIQMITDDLKRREYYRSDLVRRRWKGTSAHVIFLFLYRTMDDVRTTNWICRSQWVDKELPLEFAPLPLRGTLISDDIIVDWSSHYEVMRKLQEQFGLTGCLKIR